LESTKDTANKGVKILVAVLRVASTNHGFAKLNTLSPDGVNSLFHDHIVVRVFHKCGAVTFLVILVHVVASHGNTLASSPLIEAYGLIDPAGLSTCGQ